jgi:hypothetical protein
MIFTTTFEKRRDTIVTHAWEIWTKNGLHMDAEMRRETEKTARDAANNSYAYGMRDVEWLAATVKRLAGIEALWVSKIREEAFNAGCNLED